MVLGERVVAGGRLCYNAQAVVARRTSGMEDDEAAIGTAGEVHEAASAVTKGRGADGAQGAVGASSAGGAGDTDSGSNTMADADSSQGEASQAGAVTTARADTAQTQGAATAATADTDGSGSTDSTQDATTRTGAASTGEAVQASTDTAGAPKVGNMAGAGRVTGATTADGATVGSTDTAARESSAGGTDMAGGTDAGKVAQADVVAAGGGESHEGAGGSDGAALPKTTHEKQEAAREFAQRWKGAGEKEIADTQKFWLSLLRDVFGAPDADDIIQFEKPVYVEGHKRSIDGFITLKSLGGVSRILIEQKKKNTDMQKEAKQSGGAMLSPYQQAKRYADALPLSEKPRWIVTCNFTTFAVYDMNLKRPEQKPEEVALKDFESEWWRLAFLADPTKEVEKRQEAASRQTGRLIGKLHDLLLVKCLEPHNLDTQRSLNIFCVRFVFCCYAQSTGLFAEQRTALTDYIDGYDHRQLRAAMQRLFVWLDTPKGERDRYDSEELGAFDYVDGGLFADRHVEIPFIDADVKGVLLECARADWSDIDPVIFGSIFESTLNPQTRREGGMHYTAPSNIDKVLDPLFMDELAGELAAAKGVVGKRARDAALHAFQDKLARLRFLDPACGSGNFLTRAYTRLRTLENEAILAMSENADIARGQNALGTNESIVKVSLDQFWGIEINDFAVSVAKTALWIAERQLLEATEQMLGRQMDFLPISTQTHIAEGNALRLDWGTMEGAKAGLTVKDTPFTEAQGELCFDDEAGEQKAGQAQKAGRLRFDYIMGNPPFVGHQYRTKDQVDDMRVVFTDLPKHGKLDYVAAWYKKAADFMQGTKTKAAFVSTNSITQGEPVGIMWPYMFDNKGVEIQFAYRTFRWDSESDDVAHVHCVIIGFSCFKDNSLKTLYDGGQSKLVKHINGYLLPAPDIYIRSRTKQLTSGLPKMIKGSQPTDGGHLILSDEERAELVKHYPQSKEFIRQYMGSEEFINKKVRWCLWLKDVSPSKYRKIKPITARLEQVKEFRKTSPTESVKNDATPALFTQIRQPDSNYIVIPEVSSEKRKYVPMGFMTPDIICSNRLRLIPNAEVYHFGVLTSSVHMAWMRAVCGRFEMRYLYSPFVYNNFVWPQATDQQRQRIEQTAKAILTAREEWPDASLADLYDDNTMPKDLRRAHEANDRAVLSAYGWAESTQETDIVARLMELYQQKAGG